MASPDTTDRQRLLRYLDNALPSDERARVEARLEQDAAFRAQYERLQAVHATVQAAGGSTFDDGFADRVMDRVQAASPDPLAALYEPLRALFFRLALASLLLIGALGGYNAVRYHDTAAVDSPVEAALGLPDVTYQTALEDAWVFDPDS
jgi:anti-sigma factor RsiW